MSIFDPGHTWNTIKAELEKLSPLVPSGKTLELFVFGGVPVLYWGMEDRLSRDIDVQQSKSSDFLLDLLPSASGIIRRRDSAGPDPQTPYVEIAPPETDHYLPRFSAHERVPVASNVVLILPAPVDIAASKVAFADRIQRIKDLRDIAFIQERFGVKRADILPRLFSIERESHRRNAIMVWNQLEQLIREIPERLAKFEEARREFLGRTPDQVVKDQTLKASSSAEKISDADRLPLQRNSPEQDQGLEQSL
jgi:hypothetical protein